MLRIFFEIIRTSAKRLAGVCGLKKQAGLALGIAAACFMSNGYSTPMPPAADRIFLGEASGVTLAASTNPITVRVLDAMRRKAADTGVARIIVGVRAPFAPEGLLTSSAAAQQRNEIAAAQASVLDKVVSLKQKPGKIKRFEIIPFMALEVDAAELEALAVHPGITSIEEDKLSRPALAQSVPLIGGENAWNNSYTGAGQTIAILDTGVDKNHPFLTGKVVSEACYSTTNATHFATSLCPGGVTQSTAADSAMPYASGVCPPGKCDHGTHVVGIAAGKDTNFSGVAKDASLIAIQVFSKINDNAACDPWASPCVLTYESDWILGLQRVFALRTTHNIASVNMSLGGGKFLNTCNLQSASASTMINSLFSEGIATVVSSGNDGYTDGIGFPACVSSAISVGATWDIAIPLDAPRGTQGAFDCTNPPKPPSSNYVDYGVVDKVACFSNSANFLDLLAPGVWINSSTPGNDHQSWPGTSMAAPHVAGAWALLKQKKPILTVTEGLNALTSTGTPVTDGRNGIVKPRIKVDAALNAIASSCTYTLSSTSFPTSAAASVASVGVTAPTGCAWMAASNAPWITVTSGASGTGNGPVGYSIAANTGTTPRTGTLTIAWQTFTVTQAAASAEIFPPLGFMPSGWVQPMGSSAPWVVATDSARDGIYSLKSGSITHNQSSVIAYTGTFTTGNISFALGVSSEATYDTLQFYIDGVLQNQWSGEVAWQTVSFPVTAGTHTLSWKYWKDASYNWGMDAAWIDSVSLPLPPASPPLIGTAVAGNGQASVAFTPGSLNGEILAGYQAVCSISSGGGSSAIFSGQSSPIIVTGLTNGTEYNCYARTVTHVGPSSWSAESNVVRPNDGTPFAPIIGAAAAGDSQISVAFSPDSLNGGTLVAHQAVCATPGGVNSAIFSGQSSPIVVTGLTNGTAYNCYARTVTNGGPSFWSAASNVVTPVSVLPVCTAITPATQTVSVGAASAPMTATCSNSPTAYAWKVQKTGAVAPTALACTGATCTVPAANLAVAGTYSVTVRANNVAGAGTQVASATVIVAAAAPAVSLSPAALTFAARRPGTTSPAQTVTLRNTGTAALGITGIAASGNFARTTTCGAALAAGASCTISATFTPTAMGARTGAVTITSNAPGSPHRIALAGTGQGARYDLNGDGKADIFWRNTASGANQIWFMNGGIKTGTATPPAQPAGWSIAGEADFNGDGKADLLWRNANGQNRMWLMDGATRLSATILSPAMAAPWAVAGAGDFNNDGKADLFWRNTATGANQVWLMNGAVRIGAPINAATQAVAWTAAGIADFNGDGKADLLWRNVATGQNQVWFMNGAIRVSTAAVPGTIPAPWIIAGTGDFNNDGKADLLWRNPANGQNTIWLMNGAAATGRTTVAQAIIWQVAGVADFSGDGKADILWRNPANGAAQLWRMNGAARLGSANLAPAMPVPWVVAK